MAAAMCVVSTASVGVCDTGTVLVPGQQIRFVRAGGVPIEATVAACRGDTVVVAYANEAYPPRAADADVLWLGSLQSLEVRLEPASVATGAIVGAVSGALIGAVVGFGAQALARVGDETDVIFLPTVGAVAGVGVVMGAGVGALVAHERGTRWKRIPLSQDRGSIVR